MDYNSNRKNLILPEYGRHIQKMVDHAVTIEDREERTKCAKTIIGIMGNMFPHLRDVNDFKHKLWDHLAIMADFNLDIDYPYELLEKETLTKRPDKIPYKNSKISYKHYGELVEKMIEQAILLEDETERKHLNVMIANHMKKSLFIWNKDSVTDERIFDDLKRMSKGKLEVEEGTKLTEFKEQPQNRNRGKKRPQNKPKKK
ncbi:DUF4290 domain-containing protein [Carboxylicivirga mesophila]|uniref:DUF4290 domain-containing protein n=2 Tax=Carboxylicivirga TaxID=1628153 RepID=A0A941F3Y2_9BACT|nr:MULTISPECIES: DUF4290 domain-containing protein [Carboxylicivirga]MBR8534830.1 DUF4290 domain-containing protein [Carboxylicivirga sediminis]MBS2210547.1 DUF4290 domain-containing protein [Carboxylicivirga mesophila]